MHKIFKTGAIMLAAAWLAGCQTTAQQNIQTLGWEPGKTYTDTFKLTRYDVPLPEGEWTLVHMDFQKNNARQTVENVSLARSRDDIITHIIELTATQNSGASQYSGWSNSSPCQFSTGLHEEVIKALKREHDCWTIVSDTIPPAASMNNGRSRDQALSAEALGLKMPGATTYSYHHFAGAKHFLDIRVFTSVAEDRLIPNNKVPDDLNWVGSLKREVPDFAWPYIETTVERARQRHPLYKAAFNASPY